MPPIATSGLSRSARQRRTSSTPTTGSGLRFEAVPNTGPKRDVIDGLAAGGAELPHVVTGEAEHGVRPISLRASRGGRSSCPTWRPASSSSAISARSLTMSVAPCSRHRRATRLADSKIVAAPVRLMADL